MWSARDTVNLMNRMLKTCKTNAFVVPGVRVRGTIYTPQNKPIYHHLPSLLTYIAVLLWDHLPVDFIPPFPHAITADGDVNAVDHGELDGTPSA